MVIFSDDNLKAGLYNFSANPNPLTCNEILQNLVDPNATWTADNVALNYNADLHNTNILTWKYWRIPNHNKL